jgi:formylglycine-generating enzyme required for sulfatase activity
MASKVLSVIVLGCLIGTQSLAQGRHGTIQIECKPGVQILFDDEPVGVTKAGRINLLIKDVKEGYHLIGAIKDGFVQQEVKIYVGRGKTLVHTVPDHFYPLKMDLKGKGLGDIKDLIGQGKRVNVPTKDKDQYGNPVMTRDNSRIDPVTGLPYEIWLKYPLLELVLIPSGEFIMGSPEAEQERHDTEGPQHRVRITQHFYLAKYEVTQVQWLTTMGVNPSRRDKKDFHAPVEYVSWNRCQEFCKRTGLSFPTEAQWEYACRAGTNTPFHFGKRLWPKWVNFNASSEYGGAPIGKSRGETIKVGALRPNAWGIYDMHGNVEEWCEDNASRRFYGILPDPVSDPVCRDEKIRHRIARGGSFHGHAQFCRSASRRFCRPTDRDERLGFRPVLRIQVN